VAADWLAARSLFEDHEDGEVLIGAEMVISAGGNECRVTFPKLQLLAVDDQHPAASRDAVVVLLRRLGATLKA
jgi:hypothetical protein